MKFITMVIAVVMTVVISFGAVAQNRWNVYAGGTLSHLCEKPWSGSYGWGGGALLGGGYEINFDPHWSLTPQIEVSYVNNGASLSGSDYGGKYANSLRTWSVNIPVIAGFRFPLSEAVGLRFGVGPYLQQAFWGRVHDSNNREISPSGNFSKRFNVGVLGEAAVETGSHFSYFFRTQYPFLKEGWIRKTINLSLGVRYTF